ncbi:MAG: UvrD-helicase domain-containing protein [Wenzhouxiangellaceae bacterium]
MTGRNPSDNPLLESGLPRFGEIRAEHAEPAIDLRLAEYQALLDELKADAPEDPAAFIRREILADDALALAWSTVGHLHAVTNSAEWRDAFSACLEKITAFYTARGHDQALYRVWSRAAAAPDFARRSDAWRRMLEHELIDFRHSGVDLETPERERFEYVLNEVVRQRLEQTRTVLDQALAAIFSNELELVDLLRYAHGNLAAEGKPADPYLFDDIENVFQPDSEHLPQWRALGGALLTQKGEFRRKVDKRVGFPPKTPQKERFEELLASLADQTELARLLERARTLPEPRYGDSEWNVLASLIRILERAAAELELVFAETGQTDFTGLSRASLHGLGDDESGYTDLALYLDRRIQHILVDEYQDTNWAQVHLLEKLTHGWQPDDGRSLFLVGDPMQSIYRFREAEVGLFIRTRAQGLGGLALEAPRLSRNFRARAELVDWVNRALGPGFPKHEDVAAGAIAFAPSAPGRDDGGQVTTLARTDEAAEARAIVDLLQARIADHAEDPEWKAAVIVRARGHLLELLPELTRRGIAFRAVKLDPDGPYAERARRRLGSLK